MWQNQPVKRPTRTLRVTFTALAALITTLGAPGCGTDGRIVALPSIDQVPKPTFITRPQDLADSPQLAALVARDTAGLPPTSEPAKGSLLPEALAALAAIDSPPTRLTRLSIYADSVYFNFNEGGVAGRSVSAVYRLAYESDPDQTPDFSVSDPTFGDYAEFSIASLDPMVPGELAAALADRYPLAAARSIDLDLGLSYGFGLVWNISLDDASGTFATVYADLDGSIIAIDQR